MYVITPSVFYDPSQRRYFWSSSPWTYICLASPAASLHSKYRIVQTGKILWWITLSKWINSYSFIYIFWRIPTSYIFYSWSHHWTRDCNLLPPPPHFMLCPKYDSSSKIFSRFLKISWRWKVCQYSKYILLSPIFWHSITIWISPPPDTTRYILWKCSS